jgi:hypothetical protein
MRHLRAPAPILVSSPSAQTPGTAEACLDSARTAAAAARHHDAIRWYHRAVARDSSLARELGLEMGHQYTWADKPDSAVAFYRAYLVAHPDDVDAEIGLGRALAWSASQEPSPPMGRASRAGDRANEIA